MDTKITKKVERHISKEYAEGVITKRDLREIQKWGQIVEEMGLAEMRRNKKWRDHKLVGSGAGYRSS